MSLMAPLSRTALVSRTAPRRTVRRSIRLDPCQLVHNWPRVGSVADRTTLLAQPARQAPQARTPYARMGIVSGGWQLVHSEGRP
jgi:hypothetical protein